MDDNLNILIQYQPLGSSVGHTCDILPGAKERTWNVYLATWRSLLFDDIHGPSRKRRLWILRLRCSGIRMDTNTRTSWSTCTPVFLHLLIKLTGLVCDHVGRPWGWFVLAASMVRCKKCMEIDHRQWRVTVKPSIGFFKPQMGAGCC